MYVTLLCFKSGVLAFHWKGMEFEMFVMMDSRFARIQERHIEIFTKIEQDPMTMLKKKQTNEYEIVTNTRQVSMATRTTLT